MINDFLEQTLIRAFAVLEVQKSSEMRRLSLIDSALVLTILPNHPKLSRLRTQLAKRLSRRLTSAWIGDGDLFEVFLVLTALWQYNPIYVSGDNLVAAIKRLTRCEKAPGGPYYSNGVIELKANIQIAYFIRLIAKPLPKLDAFLHHAIRFGRSKDANLDHPYFLYILTVLYNCPEAVKYITRHRSETVAYQAVALTILKGKASPVQHMLKISNEQKPAGLWAKERLLENQIESPIATTAFIAGVLAKYQQTITKLPISDLKRRHEKVALATKQLFSTHSEPLRSSAVAATNKVCRANRGIEITLFSYFFSRSLRDPVYLTNAQYTLLGAASICGWIAYTIYDDFIDGRGSPVMLPTANVAMRTSLDCFRATLPGRIRFQQYVSNVFASMDEANAWELVNCRFTVKANEVTIAQMPQYRKGAMLATRSFAHALGPMAVLAYHVQCSSMQVRCVESALRHYLIARQIHDDLHDWQEDMQAGQASYVVTTILRDMHIAPGVYNMVALLSAMQKRFMHKTMPRICSQALDQVRLAKQSFAKSELLESTSEIYALLSNLEKSIQNSLDQHVKALALLKS